MPESHEKICQNCARFETFTDKRSQVHYLCYKGDETNIFFFGPKHVTPHDTCIYFQQKTR